MKLAYQVHLTLWEVELDDEGNPDGSADLRQEENLHGHTQEFSTLEEANKVFYSYAAAFPEPTSKYQELLDFAEKQGKIENDLLIWFANSDVESWREMSRKDLIRELLDGISPYNRQRLMSWWEDLEEEAVVAFKEDMVNFWRSKHGQ